MSGTDNRVVEMNYLRNNGASWISPNGGLGLGTQVSPAGDANGDGFADLLVAATQQRFRFGELLLAE